MSELNNLVTYRGEHFTPQFEMLATDITGWSIEMSVRASFGAVVLFTKAATIIDAAHGVFEMSLDESDTDRVPGLYVYDVWRTDTGNEHLLSIGTLVIKSEARI